MSRINADMKIWLFDLAHGNLNDSTVLSGFVKYYVLHDMNVHDVHSYHDVVRDIVFNTSYGDEGVVRARETLVSILNKLSLAQNIEILP